MAESRDPAPVVTALIAVGLADRLSLDDSALHSTRSDQSGHRSAGAPVGIVTPQSTAEVQDVMRAASATRTPVVVRGAGTGLAGAAVAGPGELVLSTAALDRLLSVSPVDGYAIVQPGILNGRLNELLEPYGVWFTPDPASRAISTVGGNIATNAGGLLCVKYGVTRDSVLGLSVVLADGELLTLGRRTIKGVTGLDLTALFVGSEGTLGVIVEATVKIVPLVRSEVRTIRADFVDEDAAARACAAIGASGLRPAVLEMLGGSAVAAIVAYRRGFTNSAREPAATVILQVDGAGAVAEAETASAILAAGGGTVTLAESSVAGEDLLTFRREFHPAMAMLGTVLIEDVCVPRSRLSAMFGHIHTIEKRYNIVIPTVAHAGDGNLHPNFTYQGEEVPDVIWAAAGDLFEAALGEGGTLTGEHGVGLLKKRWLERELGPVQRDVQNQIRAVFDPQGLMNPGKAS